MIPEVNNILMALISDLMTVMITFMFIRSQFTAFRGHKVILAVCLSVYYLLVVYCHLTNPFPLSLLVVNVPFVFAITLFYEGSTQKRILSTLFTYVIMALVEVAGLVVIYVIPKPMSTFQYDVIKIIVVKGMTLLVLLLYTRLRKKDDIRSKVSLRALAKLFFVPVLSLIVIVVFTFADNVQPYLVILIITVLLVINFLVFMLYSELGTFYDQKMKMHFAQEQSKYYMEYLQDVIANHKALIIYQHDIKNRLLSIKSYIDTGKVADAQEYIQELIDVKVTPHEYAQTDIIEIDSIINDKLTRAKEMGSEITFKAAIPTDIRIDANDIATIIGNMLDNALDALSTVPEDSRSIYLTLSYIGGNFTVSMRNSFVTASRKKPDGKYYTTKSDTLHHGYGLDSIDAIAGKYHGTLECSDNGQGIFTTRVILFEK